MFKCATEKVASNCYYAIRLLSNQRFYSPKHKTGHFSLNGFENLEQDIEKSFSNISLKFVTITR